MKFCRLMLTCVLFADVLSAQSQNDGVPAALQKGFRPLTAALHVHSRFSNGEHEILELASLARERKIDVLGITDSFITRVRFGIGPWKKLVSRSMSRPGVLDHGIDAYFGSMEEAQQRFDDVLLIPGLEVAPYYYWQGTWPNTLELYDFDRHIIVFGMHDRQAILNLPVIENDSKMIDNQ